MQHDAARPGDARLAVAGPRRRGRRARADPALDAGRAGPQRPRPADRAALSRRCSPSGTRTRGSAPRSPCSACCSGCSCSGARPRLRWGHLLLAGWLLALAWMVSLVMIDGLAKGWTDRADQPERVPPRPAPHRQPVRVPAHLQPLHRLRRRRDRRHRLDHARRRAPPAGDAALLGARTGRPGRRLLGRPALHPRVLGRGGRDAGRPARARCARRRPTARALRRPDAGRGVDGGVGGRAVRRGRGRRARPGLPRSRLEARAPPPRLEPRRAACCSARRSTSTTGSCSSAWSWSPPSSSPRAASVCAPCCAPGWSAPPGWRSSRPRTSRWASTGSSGWPGSASATTSRPRPTGRTPTSSGPTSRPGWSPGRRCSRTRVVRAVGVLLRGRRLGWTQDVVVALLSAAGTAAALVADVSAMSKAETERIWLTFGVPAYAGLAIDPSPRGGRAGPRARRRLGGHGQLAARHGLVGAGGTAGRRRRRASRPARGTFAGPAARRLRETLTPCTSASTASSRRSPTRRPVTSSVRPSGWRTCSRRSRSPTASASTPSASASTTATSTTTPRRRSSWPRPPPARSASGSAARSRC